jgi:hypothetical protein
LSDLICLGNSWSEIVASNGGEYYQTPTILQDIFICLQVVYMSF